MSYGCFNDRETLILEAGETIELLFKFVTYREVSHEHNVESTPAIVKQRTIKIEILGSNSVA